MSADKALKETLDDKFELESEEFQQKWDQVSAESVKNLTINSIIAVETYEAKLQFRKVFSIASGQDETEIKIYSYCRYVASPLLDERAPLPDRSHHTQRHQGSDHYGQERRPRLRKCNRGLH